MGSSNSKPELADLDIYICGISKRSSYYRILKSIFNKKYSYYNSFIQLKNRDENYYINNTYNYEYRYFEETIKNDKKEEKTIKYNSYIFSDIPIEQSFSKVLSFYFYEFDVHNNRKNVLMCFNNENQIQNSISELINLSNESLPISIFISNNKNFDERLDYINYIPSLNKIRTDLTNMLNNEDKPDNNIDIPQLSENTFITYLKTKLFRIYCYYNEIGYNLNFINPLNEINSNIITHATIALVGESGCGKSTLLNFAFNELVSRINTSSIDVTTKCSEYYLPIKYNNEKIGQLRFLDFPGLKGERNYKIVKDEIENKIKEYKNNLEQIDIALFYISNGNNRDLNGNTKNIIKLLHKYKIKIIFIINGTIRPEDLINKKQSLKNGIGNDDILNNNYDNFINSDYKLDFDLKRRDGISTIFSKINDIIKNNVENYNINNIDTDNYENELEILSQNNRIFHNYGNFEILQQTIKLKSQLLVSSYSFGSFSVSFLSIVVPVVDTALSISLQTAMVFHLFKLYNEEPGEYEKFQIIVSNGDIIKKKYEYVDENYQINNFADNIAARAIGVDSRIVIEAGKEAIKNSIKEAGKEVIKTGVKEVTKEAVEITSKNVVNLGIQQTVKQLAKEGIKETAKQVAKEGVGEAIEVTTKETIKQVTENVIVKEGSKVWLANLGKFIPLIGAGISCAINTYSTAKTGHKLLTYLEKNCINNRKKRVEIIKSKILSVQNIIRQVNLIIEEQENVNNQARLLIN